MSFALPDLPYAHDALEPHMSKSTFEFHHDKHHQKYVDTLNDLIKGTDNEGKSLEDIIKSSEGKLFNQAAQVWNHTFYWHCMKPGGGGKPHGKVAELIDRDLGGYDQFVKQLAVASSAPAGPGWSTRMANCPSPRRRMRKPR